jgi:hypothetical protein
MEAARSYGSEAEADGSPWLAMSPAAAAGGGWFRVVGLPAVALIAAAAAAARGCEMRRSRGRGLAFLYSFFLAAGVWDSEALVTEYVTDQRARRRSRPTGQ